jgi:hypothetical protein
MSAATVDEAPLMGSVEAAALRIASLLTGSGTTMSDAGGRSDIEFEPVLSIRPLGRSTAPDDVWAIDGGQITVADARCLSVVATRSARVRFRRGACELEEEGDVRVHVLGAGETAAARASLDLDGVLAPDCAVDINLVRDRWEWDAVARSIEDAESGALVLVDGDLQPDWRIPSSWLGALLERAASRGVVLAGITKHSSLARGGAPLLGQLELEAAALYGRRSMWWSTVGRVRRDVAAEGLQVVAARLDPDAAFAFRVDLPAAVDAVSVLGRLSALCDDAAFPGYPYPLTVADRLAACPGWLAADVRMQLDDQFDRQGVPFEVRERAFADRHHLMERS